jgi:hypothetical protein
VWQQRFERQPGKRWADALVPVRIAKSALAPSTPHRDLFVSQYHCLYLDGVLIPAMHLVNRSSISRYDVDHLRAIEYFHIKLDDHAVVFAEGAACETLLAVTRENSDAVEYREYTRLHGEPLLPDRPAAPILGYNGGRARLRGRIRSALAPIVDVRGKLEIVRDRLRQRARTVGRSG